MRENGMRTVAILGCGVMGAGIASVFAEAGHAVRLYDADAARAAQVAGELVRHGPRIDARAGLGLEDAVRGADLVIEAVAEALSAKREVLGRAGAADGSVVIASNTSSLPVAELAAAIAGPERFVVAHFFNPAATVPLVEVVPGPSTDPAVVSWVAEELRAVGKRPVVLRRAVPGFVANRLQAALLREAFALEADGVAELADIDEIVRSGLGSRWAAAGPFALADLGGLDVWAAVCAQLFPLLDAGTEAPDLLRRRVVEGRLGAKAGVGLYPHVPDEDDRLRARIAEHFAREFPQSPAQSRGSGSPADGG